MWKESKKQLIYRVLSCIFGVVFVLGLGVLIYNEVQKNKSQNIYEDMQQETTVSTEETTEQREEESTEESHLDWKALKEQNPHIYAWISIPGTQIEYPVLQHPEDDSYYLMRNIDGSEGYPGCIYTELINAKDFSDFHTVLYGHNMKNGTMFADLHKFEDGGFFEENPYIYIYTPEKSYQYEIFAAYEFTDVHLLYAFDYATKENREQYIEMILQGAAVTGNLKKEVSIKEDSQIITLSTCDSSSAKTRYLVQGVFMEE